MLVRSSSASVSLSVSDSENTQSDIREIGRRGTVLKLEQYSRSGERKLYARPDGHAVKQFRCGDLVLRASCALIKSGAVGLLLVGQFKIQMECPAAEE